MNCESAVALLADLRKRHIDFRVVGDRLRVRAPRGMVSPETREALRAVKPKLIDRLKLEARFLDLSLDDSAHQDYGIEMAVPWFTETLWFVPRLEHVESLVGSGVHRGRIWTGRELEDFISLPGMTSEEVVNIARLKATFGGEILSLDPATPTSGCR